MSIQKELSDILEIHLKDYRNRAFAAAYKKGWLAAQAGQGKESCPYPDRRTVSGKITYARAFLRVWHDGYENYRKHEKNLKELMAEGASHV